tara:strand:- start:180 stop:332 length:153 start_codon:yes stop_codon:yes gene_type:complete
VSVLDAKLEANFKRVMAEPVDLKVYKPDDLLNLRRLEEYQDKKAKLEQLK